MRTTVLFLTLSTLAGHALPGADVVRAQAPATFDVASIRRNTSGQQQGGGLAAPQPGGRYIGIGVTLQRLVSDAYEGLDVFGGPAWATRDRFDVNARGADGQSPVEIRGMLRSMLAERFKLTAHGETREMPVYSLTIARRDRRLGPKLRASDAKCTEEARRFFPGAAGVPPSCGDFRLGARALTARGMTMAALARLLAERGGRAGLDRTGLEGFYDLELEWSSDVGLERAPVGSAGAGELTADGLSLFTALQEQLGLKLEAGRGPVNVIVIDRAEPPSEN